MIVHPLPEEPTIKPQALAYLLLEAALDKKAISPVLLAVDKVVDYADFFIVCSGASVRQVQAIADAVEAHAKKSGVRPLSVEGQTLGKWILMDYQNVVVHILYEPVRPFYDLESLWSDARSLPLEPEAAEKALSDGTPANA